RTGTLRHTLKKHKLPVAAVAFSPDGKMLASSSRQVMHTELTPKGKPEASPPGEDVCLWDVGSGKPVGTIEVKAPAVPSLAFSPDGGTLATLSWRPGKNYVEGEAIGFFEMRSTVTSLWDVASRTLHYTLESPGATLIAKQDNAQIAFHPSDGSLVTVAGRML